MYRTFVILRHTFLEAILQPIYSLLIAIGAVILMIFAALPFFTLGEDTVMFKSVGQDVILLLVLIATLFATSRSIYEEIEDRTMLTLMSKPLSKWQVLLGKYLGIVLAAGLAVGALGIIICLSIWWRIPSDYQFNARSLDERELLNIFAYRKMHITGMIASLTTCWMQISVLAAISVAISTRVSLVVNLPVVIILYIAGNLSRFLFPIYGPAGSALWGGRWAVTKGFAYAVGNLLPFLSVFDIKAKTIYAKIAMENTPFQYDVNAVHLSEIFRDVGLAGVYAIAYITFALTLGLLLFQNRELGGGEG